MRLGKRLRRPVRRGQPHIVRRSASDQADLRKSEIRRNLHHGIGRVAAAVDDRVRVLAEFGLMLTVPVEIILIHTEIGIQHRVRRQSVLSREIVAGEHRTVFRREYAVFQPFELFRILNADIARHEQILFQKRTDAESFLRLEKPDFLRRKTGAVADDKASVSALRAAQCAQCFKFRKGRAVCARLRLFPLFLIMRILSQPAVLIAHPSHDIDSHPNLTFRLFFSQYTTSAPSAQSMGFRPSAFRQKKIG